MNIASWIVRAGNIAPELPAVGLGRSVFHDYANLARRVAGLAGGLITRYNLKSGDRVAVFMSNVPQYVEVMFALWHVGLVAVPVNVKLHPKELEYILAKGDVSLCVVNERLNGFDIAQVTIPVLVSQGPSYEKLVNSAPASLRDLSVDHLAWIFFTSGTTGKPKGAMLSHRNLLTMTLNYFVDFDRVRPGETIYHSAPLSHGAGLWMLPHVCAMACNVVPESGFFNPHEVLSDLQYWPGVSMFAAPTMVRRLTLFEPDMDTRNLKLITFGGAPMYVPDCIAALDRFGPKLAQLYGQGESPMTISHLDRVLIADRQHPDWAYRLGTAGIQDSCISIRIVDEKGAVVPEGEIGEITCRGDVVMNGYWRDEKASRETLKNGWLYTGDIGHMDKDGFLTLTGRSKDTIISGGSNIYPREVEEVLLLADGVNEVSVISRPDLEWGEVVVAYIVGDCDEPGLDAHCLTHMARFKRPKFYRFVEKLPKNNYGKVLKTSLREQENVMLQAQSQDSNRDI